MSENVPPATAAVATSKGMNVRPKPLTSSLSPGPLLVRHLMKTAKSKGKGGPGPTSKPTPRRTTYRKMGPTMDKETITNAIDAFPYVYKFIFMVYQFSPFRTVVIVSVFLVQSLLPALRLRTGGDFIRQLQLGIEKGSLNTKSLIGLAITQAITYLIEHSLQTLLRSMEDKTQHKLVSELGIELMKAHLRLDLTQMMDNDIQTAFSRAQNTLATKPMDLLIRQLQWIQNVISNIAEAITLASMTPRQAWILIVISLLSPIIESLMDTMYIHREEDLPEEYMENLQRASTMQNFAHSRAFRPEVMVFSLQSWIITQYRKASDIISAYERPADPNSLRHQILDHFTNFIQMSSRATMYLVVALMPNYFSMPLASLTYLEEASQRIYRNGVGVWHRMAFNIMDLENIKELFECLEIKSGMDVVNEEDCVKYESVAGNLGVGMKVEMKNVWFKYPGKADFVLKGVSFVLQPGETLALLGYNGSGKSTIVKLLTRLFDPAEGEILINDVDIKKYHPDDLYHHMSVLFQDYHNFTPLKARETIGIGDIDTMTPETVRQASIDGGADSFLEALPLKYDTELTRSRFLITDGGAPMRLGRRGFKFPKQGESTSTDLSGGQWQRIALSRAFMRSSSADLLVLDEPSSNLDPEAEHELFKFIRNARKGRTTIYVTHRFYTVRMANKIAFLEGGELREWGSHEELMKIKEGKYAKLFQLQSEGFSTLGQDVEGS